MATEPRERPANEVFSVYWQKMHSAPSEVVRKKTMLPEEMVDIEAYSVDERGIFLDIVGSGRSEVYL